MTEISRQTQRGRSEYKIYISIDIEVDPGMINVSLLETVGERIAEKRS